MGNEGCPISRGREDVHVLLVLYWEAPLARTSEAKCRCLPLSQREPEQRPALHESPSGAGLLQPRLPGASLSPSPSPPVTTLVLVLALHGRAGAVCSGQKPPGSGHMEPCAAEGERGCSLSKAARKRKNLLIPLERPQRVSEKGYDVASHMPTKSLS